VGGDRGAGGGGGSWGGGLGECEVRFWRSGVWLGKVGFGWTRPQATGRQGRSSISKKRGKKGGGERVKAGTPEEGKSDELLLTEEELKALRGRKVIDRDEKSAGRARSPETTANIKRKVIAVRGREGDLHQREKRAAS